MTQEEFALRYNFKLRALQNWEQGRLPDALVQSYLWLAIELHAQRRESEVEKACRRAIALGQRLTADCPDVPDYRLDLAQSYSSLSNTLCFQAQTSGRIQEAEQACRQALELCEKLPPKFANTPECALDADAVG